MGVTLGREVGYTIRFDDRTDRDATRIKCAPHKPAHTPACLHATAKGATAPGVVSE